MAQFHRARVGRRHVRSTIVASVIAAVFGVAAVTIARVLLWAGGDGIAALSRGRATTDDALGAVAAAAGLAFLAWICVAVLAALMAATPGFLGGAAASISARVTPVVVHRLIAAALGVGIAGGSVGTAFAATPSAGAASSIVTVSGSATQPAAAQSWVAPPYLDRPSTPSVPAAPIVTVVPGDCLWSIAAAHLGAGASNAAIDREWRRWYAANLDVVGPDPDLLQPGQRLVAPA